MSGNLEECESEGAIYAAPLLMTKRLVLGAPYPRHADQIVALANNKRVAEMVASMPHPYSRADALDWIEKSRTATDLVPCRFAVFLRDRPDLLIGACGAGALEESGDVHLGYWIGEPHWGNGYATEAAQAVIDFVFELTDLASISSACRVINPASRRVIEKCGFQYHGAGLMHSVALGGAVAVEHYCLDRALWAGLRGWRDRPRRLAEPRPREAIGRN